MDPNSNSVSLDTEEVDPKVWEEAASLLEIASGVTAPSPRKANVPPVGQVSSAPTTPTTKAEAFQQETWEPGMMFHKLKQRFRDPELLKKVKDNEFVGKFFRPMMDPKSEEVASPSDRESTSVSVQSESEGNKGLLGLNHPIYNTAVNWKNKTRDESKKKTMDAHNRLAVHEDGEGSKLDKIQTKFASVTISNIKLESLPSRAKRAPYVAISIEGQTQSTSRAPSKGPYSWTNSTLEFEINDVWADLAISVFAARAGSEVVAIEDEFVGKGFLPISCLVIPKDQPYLRTLFTGTNGGTFQANLALDLLPLAPSSKTYARCVEGMPSTGMARPSEATGRISFQVQVQTRASLSKALILAPPIRRPALPSKNEPLNPALLHQRKMRLKNIVTQYSASFELLSEGLLSWRYPFATWVWLTLFAQITLFSQWYHLPFFTVVCAVLGAYFVRMQRLALGTPSSPILYSDETTLDPDLPQTLPAKVKSLQALASAVQMLLGTAASLMERIYHSLSWEDPFVSFLVSCLLVIGSFLVSFGLMLLHEFSIVWRTAIFMAGICLHIPSSYQKTARTKLSQMFKSWRSVAKTIKQPWSYSSASTRDQSVEEMLDEMGKEEADAHTLAESTRSHHLPTKEEVRWALANLFKRIPDGLEIDHRRIAQSRTHKQD